MYYWTPQLIRSMKIFFVCVCKVNKTNVTDTYLRISRNKVFDYDFVDEAGFAYGQTDT